MKRQKISKHKRISSFKYVFIYFFFNKSDAKIYLQDFSDV